MTVGLNLLLVSSAALLAVGGFAVVARRNAVITLLGTQFMLLAGGIAFVAFGRFGLGAQNRNAAAAMAMFAGAVAVAQLAIGLAMAAIVYREQRSFILDADRG
jgi:NADH:ubiquinone oxidoreductase subunit K